MTNNTQKDSFSDFVRNPSPETSEIMRKAADSSQKKMDDMVKDVKLDTQTDWEKHKVWAKTIANMVYGFNGSDKNNPPVKGLDGATQTLEDILADTRREVYEKGYQDGFDRRESAYKYSKDVLAILRKEEGETDLSIAIKEEGV